MAVMFLPVGRASPKLFLFLGKGLANDSTVHKFHKFDLPSTGILSFYKPLRVLLSYYL
jgi:hypothetical protein